MFIFGDQTTIQYMNIQYIFIKKVIKTQDNMNTEPCKGKSTPGKA